MNMIKRLSDHEKTYCRSHILGLVQH